MFLKYPLCSETGNEDKQILKHGYLLGHSMSSQPPDGRHVTDFAENLHTIRDMKKNPRTRR